MKNHKRLYHCLGLAALLFLVQIKTLKGEAGYWKITHFEDVTGIERPTINNSGEILWEGGNGGIFSSVRGTISASGFAAHLSNSGEVVYADWFGGPNWDLVSNTRGRLTYGGIIDINSSDFDVNSDGEVVYTITDTNGLSQIYSTVRGQITTGAAQNKFPCINDNGEIVWNQAIDGLRVSSTRGNLDYGPPIADLNNSDDYCFTGDLEVSPGFYTWPHVILSAHGAIVTDPGQYEWGGAINDAGVMVWMGRDGIYDSGGLYEGVWVPSPTLSILQSPEGMFLQWPTNTPEFQAEYTTNEFSTVGWQALTSVRTINGTNFNQAINVGSVNAAYFRLAYENP